MFAETIQTNTQYFILPAKITHRNPNTNLTSLTNKTYNLWKNIWNHTFKENGCTRGARSDDFFRQNFIPIIKNEDDIIAIHFYSLYSFLTPNIYEQSYLKEHFPEQFFKIMEEKNINLAMTMESLCVNPKYRKSKIGQSSVHTLVILGMKIFFEYTQCDAIITPARADLGVADIGYSLGFTPAIKGINLYNTPVDLIYFKRNDKIKYPNDEIKEQVKTLWDARIDYLNDNYSNNLSKAA